MSFQNARERVKEAFEIIMERSNGLLNGSRAAIHLIGNVARYARGRVREQYLGQSADPVVAIVTAFIIEAGNELIEGKRDTAMAIADERRLAQEIETEARNAQEWEKRAQLAAKNSDDASMREALERKREHEEMVERLRMQWKSQAALVDNLKTNLRRLNHLIEKAKRTKVRLATRRFVRRAEELEKQVQRMDQIVKGLDLLTELDRSSRPVNNETSTDESR